MPNIWEFKNYDQQIALEIQNKLGISALQARLLALRGVCNAEEADHFIHANLNRLTDPFSIEGIAAAVARIEQAADNQEKVIIYGDYDVDGICSVVILQECLQAIGCRVEYYVPDRFEEGYGLNQDAVVCLAQQGCKLLITVDCGISSVLETQLAVSLGMDVIITDHHTLPSVLPDALAIINPKNGAREVSVLCGAGVAFKLAAALLTGKNMEDKIREWLPLVALATVADMVPLLDENRILVKNGIQLMLTCQRIGIHALLKESGMSGKSLQAWQLGFVLGPRLNAAGRMGSARTSIELLLCQDPEKAQEKADQLGHMNNERRIVEESIFQEAVANIERESDLERSVLVVGGEGWHVGVIGIVASRLVAMYNRPAIVISWDGEVGKGSARSPEGFDLYMALDTVKGCLLGFGGHKMAAGLTLRKENLLLLQKGLADFTADIGYHWAVHKHFYIDMEMDEDAISLSTFEEIKMLEPFGEGNPVPVFALRAGAIQQTTRVGLNRAHLRLAVGHNNLPGIAFNWEETLDTQLNHCCQDILFTLDINDYRGKRNLQLKVKDMKPAFLPDDTVRTDYSHNQLLKGIKKATDEIMAQHPVVFVYPSYRSLGKHQPAMNWYFSPGKVLALHGHLSPEERIRGQKLLKQGSSMVYMVTRAFLRYYHRRAQLPANLRFLVQLWPGPSLAGDIVWPENIENVIIQQNNQFRFHVAGDNKITRGRVFMYANLPSTVERLHQCHQRARIESGITDMKVRRNLRREYWQNEEGLLISDGTHMVGWPGSHEFDELILADSPLGLYELAALVEAATDEEFEVGVAFNQDGLGTNQQFLNRLYPNLELVNQVWFRILNQKPREGINHLEDLMAALSGDLNISRLEVASVLHILADLNLCHFQKKGSIMAINRGSSGNYIESLDSSPYWLEGLAEMLILSDWEQRLTSGLGW